VLSADHQAIKEAPKRAPKTSLEGAAKGRYQQALDFKATQGGAREENDKNTDPSKVENAIAIVFFATLQPLFVFFLGSSLPRVTRLIHPS
jgi:hypothetical protein